MIGVDENVGEPMDEGILVDEVVALDLFLDVTKLDPVPRLRPRLLVPADHRLSQHGVGNRGLAAQGTRGRVMSALSLEA